MLDLIELNVKRKFIEKCMLNEQNTFHPCPIINSVIYGSLYIACFQNVTQVRIAVPVL